MNIRNTIRFLRNKVTVLIIDILMIPAAWFGAYWIRFNMGKVPDHFDAQALHFFIPLIIIQVLAFWIFGLYRGIWRFASVPDLIRILKAAIIGVLVFILFLFLFSEIKAFPRSIFLLYAWLLVSLLVGIRAVFRWLKDYRGVNSEDLKRVLIVGAGEAGELLVREILRDNRSNYRPVVFVDDKKTKQGREIHGIRVAGFIKDIPNIVERYKIEMVIISIPSLKSDMMRNILQLCEEVSVPCRITPSLDDIISGRASIKALRDVSLEDLLGREPVSLDWEHISKGLSNKTILVSGGGGSIGSELCWQIANLCPALLVVIDNSEFNLYTIEKDLKQHFPNLKLAVHLIDVVDSVALNAVMHQYKPQIVFHAAAYKHVPILEFQIRAAMRNNILGSYFLAKAAVDCGVESFVLISTDKAVNPTNIMGAAKRAAEVICQNYNGKSDTHFTTVRFGNVLGSAGSVIPLFKSQLEQGGPITVTHPEISRYFMTIPEASQLILQATIMGKGGEIFVLDMGKPILIRFLAEQMIQLSGKSLDEIPIVYTGLRPGEKLYEELFHETEKLVPTKHNKILKAHFRKWDWENLLSIINKIIAACGSLNEDDLKRLLSELVPEYSPTKH